MEQEAASDGAGASLAPRAPAQPCTAQPDAPAPSRWAAAPHSNPLASACRQFRAAPGASSFRASFPGVSLA